MQRDDIVNKIGNKFRTSNIEGGEFSYVKAAGGKDKLEKVLKYKPKHFKVDIRFKDKESDVVVLVETKANFVEADKEQLKQYVEEEKAVFNTKKIIAILTNTDNDECLIWKNDVSDDTLLKDEDVIDTMGYYSSLFDTIKQNNRELVLKNTYNLNEMLHKLDIDEKLRSQFVGTVLLYIKDEIAELGISIFNEEAREKLITHWSTMKPKAIIGGIESVLDDLLDESENKTRKIQLLQKNVLKDQKVKKLTTENWTAILIDIVFDIYKYIDVDSSEGQDILNLFFIAFNKYTGKADKNQAFTPDHITDFMCRITGVDCYKKVLDPTCGSGSFLVQAMVKELAACNIGVSHEVAKARQENVMKQNIFGIENEEKAYGLATTNMLIHGDGNSNIRFGNMFESRIFIESANPDIILMNPPYNAKPVSIPEYYKTGWGKSANGKEDPTKGLVFIQYLSDVIKAINEDRISQGINPKNVKCAVLLPLQCAIGSSKIITNAKSDLLKNNTLDAVFSLPNEIFYPGANVCVCCMLFTLGKPHVDSFGKAKETFFGYYKDDGFKKKKNLGRVEQFRDANESIWREIEETWIDLYHNKREVDGLSAMHVVTAEDEWLCEAYMKTDYSKLTQDDFQRTLNNYLSYLVKEGKVYEA